jgi:hypothetical protein
MRALRLELVPVDHHARRATGHADAERSNDDIGEAAVLFERRWMADDGLRSCP